MGENGSAMTHSTRRRFLRTSSAATIASTFAIGAATRSGFPAAEHRMRVFIASHTAEGILKYDWDPATATLTPAGVAAKIAAVAWLAFSHEEDFVYSASELDAFQGKPTGEVASFRQI